MIALIVHVRPWRHLGAVVAGVIAFGYATHAIVRAISPVGRWPATPAAPAGSARLLNGFVIVPTNPTNYGNVLYLVLIGMLIAIVQLHGIRRLVAVVVTIYVAACCWEARLIVNPAITTQIMIGAILIVTMAARPNGLLGTRRVEVL